MRLEASRSVVAHWAAALRVELVREDELSRLVDDAFVMISAEQRNPGGAYLVNEDAEECAALVNEAGMESQIKALILIYGEAEAAELISARLAVRHIKLIEQQQTCMTRRGLPDVTEMVCGVPHHSC